MSQHLAAAEAAEDVLLDATRATVLDFGEFGALLPRALDETGRPGPPDPAERLVMPAGYFPPAAVGALA